MIWFALSAVCFGMWAWERFDARGRVFGAPCIRLGLRCLEFGNPEERPL